MRPRYDLAGADSPEMRWRIGRPPLGLRAARARASATCHRLKHKACVSVADCVLTGVAFCGSPGKEHVAVSAYDTDAVLSYSIAIDSM